ncbi:rwd domain-containing protein [Cystoisospora suis]|uniref:Rwd domain-containing protein n=1 Tax=Cystoisospora suis TaxID=483139 RepID=A0A2C6L1B5_9APIC|nr:rwd domain-containing protein [Cystoisospora suis]
MANHAEDQELELEALEALFTREGEYEKLSNSSFRLRLCPFPDKEETNHVSIELSVEFPPEYPDTVPHWSISESKGLDNEALDELKIEITECIEREVGAAMIYTVAESIQEWLRKRNKPQQSMYDQMMSRENGEDQEEASDAEGEGKEEEKQYTGLGEKQLCDAADRCTKEEFDRWAEKFRQEMVDKGIWKGTAISGSRRTVLTGKQLFEVDASLATADTSIEEGEDDEDTSSNGGGGAAPSGDKQMFWKDESLFEGDDEEILVD